MVAGLYLLVIPAGFEPAISWMRTRCPEPLDDGTTYTILNYKGSNLGFGHLRRPRNFAIENKFSSEDFLADCHWAIFTRDLAGRRTRCPEPLDDGTI